MLSGEKKGKPFLLFKTFLIYPKLFLLQMVGGEKEENLINRMNLIQKTKKKRCIWFLECLRTYLKLEEILKRLNERYKYMF